MDLNQLYFDHQVLLMQAQRARSESTIHQYEVGASSIAGRIGYMQRVLGATAAPVWEALAAVDGRSLVAPIRHHQGYVR